MIESISLIIVTGNYYHEIYDHGNMEYSFFKKENPRFLYRYFKKSSFAFQEDNRVFKNSFQDLFACHSVSENSWRNKSQE